MAVKITNEVLESYLHCKFKAHLKLAGQQGTRSDFEGLLTELRAEVRLKAIDTILTRHPGDQVARNIPLTIAALKRGPRYILDGTLEDESVALHFDGLTRMEGESKLGDFHYLPVLFHEGRQVKKGQKLLLEVYGMILSDLQGRAPVYGVIWHGLECHATRVKLNPDHRKAEQILGWVKDMATSGLPPRLLLNDHCSVCEFRQRCHDQAVNEDNISLLRGMSEKEFMRHARKGIFTVTQLSCTFRLRKKTKRAKKQSNPHYPALKALAIRDKKTYVLGLPIISKAQVRVYMDVEGDPEGRVAYLLGMIVDAGGTETSYSFWADSEDQETDLFRSFQGVVGQYQDYSLIHYGSYELKFLKRMAAHPIWGKCARTALAKARNLLSAIYSHVYFPTYSNNLKDVGKCLGCQWSHNEASGLQSLVWRRRWEETGDPSLKQQLVTYNAEDCAALKRITDYLCRISMEGDVMISCEGPGTEGPSVARAEDIPQAQAERKQRFDTNFLFPDYDYINQCAYFDYQREKVFVRTNSTIRRIHAGRRKPPRRPRVSRRIEIKCVKCIFCGSRRIRRQRSRKRHSKLMYDLRVTETGARRCVVEYTAAVHWCRECGHSFLPPKYKRRRKRYKYGHSLIAWAMYQHVANGVSFPKLWSMLKDCFGLRIPYAELYMLKLLAAEYYKASYEQIKHRLIAGNLLHADETKAKLQKATGYVWVFASLEEVFFMYRPTREGEFLQELLHGFHGVLVSDFYTAYDSLPCPQQKCLVHLIRDLNDDLRDHPFDAEFKGLVFDFGRLLRTIVATVDAQGLRSSHLKRHHADVAMFYETLAAKLYRSEVAERYQKRLLRYRDKLFTFLDHDGVPWNNNNAEHAVKHFANYRMISDGRMSERGINAYLVLLSICQTCKYKGVSFLTFLLSGERDIRKFCENHRRVSPADVYPGGFPRFNHTRTSSADKGEPVDNPPSG